MGDDVLIDAGACELPVGRVVTVEVPASSANLGPGFDALGLALNWRDSYRVEIIESGLEVALDGVHTDPVPADGQNLVVRSILMGLARAGHRAPGLRLTGHHSIPHGRGLGSSSAAIVAGLAAAHQLAVPAGRQSGGFDPEAWLGLADQIEGHPDNVAAALFGGLVLVYRGDTGAPRAARLTVHPDVAALMLVPDQPVSTEQARGLLPQTVPYGHAAANSARAALLVHALTAAPDRLFEATTDQLHQDYRAPAMPASAELLDSLRGRRLPAVLSGAGPAVLVLARSTELDAIAATDPPGFRAVRLGISAGVQVATGVE